MNSLNLEKQLDEFDSSNNKYPMYRWAMVYIRQLMESSSVRVGNTSEELELALSRIKRAMYIMVLFI